MLKDEQAVLQLTARQASISPQWQRSTHAKILLQAKCVVRLERCSEDPSLFAGRSCDSDTHVHSCNSSDRKHSGQRIGIQLLSFSELRVPQRVPRTSGNARQRLPIQRVSSVDWAVDSMRIRLTLAWK